YCEVQKNRAEISDDFGKIDILVNNAGVRRDGLSLGMSMEDWDMVINTNLKGAFNFVQATERVLIKQRSGRIINITFCDRNDRKRGPDHLRGEQGRLDWFP